MANKSILDDYLNVSENNSNSLSYEDAIAKEQATALANKNYKDYLNTSMQLFNYRNRARKYLNNQLASQGLNTQGYGSSLNAGVDNSVINAYTEVANNYNEAQNDVAQDYLNTLNQNAIERDNQLAAFITNDINTTGGQNVNKYLQNYGYMDENGNYTDAWKNLDSSRRSYLESLLVGSGSNDSINYGSVVDPSNYENRVYYYASDGSTGSDTIQNKFKDEFNYISSVQARGEIPNGSYIKLTNGFGDVLYLTYRDGQYYYISKNVYDNASSDINKIEHTKRV